MKTKNESPQKLQWWQILFLFLLAILFRWATSCGPYSGEKKPPMHGDYEAQRHWMEITYSLPIEEWYFNSTDNDLLYWGLDYPPLTAYHSWVLGAISNKINNSWVALHESRGHESYTHKLFMRYSVLVADVLLYISAVFIYVLKIQKPSGDIQIKIYYLATWLLYPGLILIDHGHFQYNCVSLGFFLWATIALLMRHDLLASISFILALSYKQMELYHALPFFCYLFGACLRQRTIWQGLFKLIKLAATVLATIAIVWLPFIVDLRQLTQVLHRLFPFARGIFEDKVANVWCALSVVIKWRKYFEIQQLVYLCGATTILALCPMIMFGIKTPTKQNFKLSLIVSSLTFFLFSFQVHEKSILLAAIPALLVFHEEPLAVGWFLLTSVVSLHPLCVKDEMQLVFFAWLLLFYIWICEFLQASTSGNAPANLNWTCSQRRLFHLSAWLGFAICFTPLILNPPIRYPDLFPLLNSVFCCFQFCIFLVYFYWRMFRETFGVSLGGKQKLQ